MPSPTASAAPAPSPTPGGWTKNWDILLMVTVLVAYLPALRGGFLLDDDVLLVSNPVIASDVGLRWIWFSTQNYDYFPLTMTSFWLEWRLWGPQAAGYHVTNLLLHLAACWLLARVMNQLRLPGGMLAAVLFALHPVNVSSVAWIAERKNALSLPLCLLAVLLYLIADEHREEGRPWQRTYGMALGAFLLALLAKTSGVMIPVVMLGLVWWRRGRLTRRDLMMLAPFFALSLVLGLVTLWFQHNRAMGGAPTRTEGALGRLVTASWAIWFYLGKFVAPVRLSLFYPRWQVDTVTVKDLLPLVGLVAGLVGLLRVRARWSRATLLALGSFGVLAAPVLGFVDTSYNRYSLVADHWFHIPMVPLVVLTASGLFILGERLGSRWRSPAQTGAAIFVALLGMMTFARARVFGDIEKLWLDTLEKNPAAFGAHNGLAHLYLERGQAEMAKRHLEEAIRIKPEYPEAFNNLGATLSRLGDSEGALRAYAEAIRLSPIYAHPRRNRAFEYMDLGRLKEAEQGFREVLALDSNDARGHAGLARMLIDRGEHEQALKHIQLAGALGLVEDARLLLARGLINMGELDRAAEEVRAVLNENRTHAEAHLMMGRIAEKRGMPREAAMAYTNAARLRPNYTEAEKSLEELQRTDPAKKAEPGAPPPSQPSSQPPSGVKLPDGASN